MKRCQSCHHHVEGWCNFFQYGTEEMLATSCDRWMSRRASRPQGFSMLMLLSSRSHDLLRKAKLGAMRRHR